MSKDYVDFVLAEPDGTRVPMLFHAPAFSGLKKGDVVIVERFGASKARVVSVTSVRKDDRETIDFIMNATGADSEVKRVLSKVTFTVMDYSQGDEDERIDND